MRILVTGGAGFIGSALVRYLIHETSHEVLNLDQLTHAGNLQSLASVSRDSRYSFVKMDITQADELQKAIDTFCPDAVVHLAVASHDDTAPDRVDTFIQTNVIGTYRLLQAIYRYWSQLPEGRQRLFRFVHASTEEVYGALGVQGPVMADTAYAPHSPHAASKAAADHLVRAWHHTYGLPTIVTNSSHSYGPYHFPEKFIPLSIINAFDHQPITVYGKGDVVHDWLYVEDHVRALALVLVKGRPGATYNLGGRSALSKLRVVETICDVVDEMMPSPTEGSRRSLITFVTSQSSYVGPYAVDTNKTNEALGWQPQESFVSGLRKTILWFMHHQQWWKAVLDGSYRLSLPETMNFPPAHRP